MTSHFISLICLIALFRKSPSGYLELCREVVIDNVCELGGLDELSECLCECSSGCCGKISLVPISVDLELCCSVDLPSTVTKYAA